MIDWLSICTPGSTQPTGTIQSAKVVANSGGMLTVEAHVVWANGETCDFIIASERDRATNTRFTPSALQDIAREAVGKPFRLAF